MTKEVALASCLFIMHRKEMVRVLWWQAYLIELAGVIAAITTIGGALIWIYKKLVAEPDQKVAKETQEKSNRELKEAIAPLSQSINRLNELLEESQSDRIALHAKDSEQEAQLDNHEVRITVLEDWRRGKDK